jgi:hypothetical protein
MFMAKMRKPEERLNWSFARERLGHYLRAHYQACTTAELPPRLLAALKQLDEAKPDLAAAKDVQAIRETKS